MNNSSTYNKLKGGLIVSCQALESEPLHSSYIMSRMAFAAKEGGAVGIRANTPEDIAEIKKTVDLPVIGIIKAEYEDSKVYITPTIKEVEALIEAGPEIIAMDATNRRRPSNVTLDEIVTNIKKKYPDQLLMADCSCIEDGIHAARMGFDFVGTTLSGYTKETKGRKLPDFQLIETLVKKLELPIIAEGGIWTVEDLKHAMDIGVFAAVIGTAITRPREITRRFVNGIEGKN